MYIFTTVHPCVQYKPTMCMLRCGIPPNRKENFFDKNIIFKSTSSFSKVNIKLKLKSRIFETYVQVEVEVKNF